MLVVQGPLVALCALVGWVIGLASTAAVMVGLLAFHSTALPRVETPRRPARQLLATVFGWRVALALALVLGCIALEWRLAVGTALRFELWRLGRSLPALTRIGTGAWIALGLLAGLLVLLAALPRLRRRVRERGSTSNYAASFVSFLDQPKIGVILAFVILFRTGESFLLKMRWPFFDDVVGLSLTSYGVLNGTAGVIVSFAATIIGGRLIARDGLRRWIWPFVLAQNVLNLLYMGLALMPEPSAFGPQTIAVAFVIIVEHAGAGLGTAVFMVYLMRTCDPEHKAGHMAIVTALMSLGFTAAGVLSGFLAEALGYARYFGFTFLATIPSMVLIFFVPYLDGREAKSGGSNRGAGGGSKPGSDSGANRDPDPTNSV